MDLGIPVIKKYRQKLNMAIVTLLVLLLFGTVIFRYIENWTWIDSFYFCVSTISTVGYGDTTPHTELGRLIASFFILISVPLIIYAFSIFARIYFDQRFFAVEKEEEEVKAKIEKK